MKLLFDQNLSRKLVPRLADTFPGSSHVQFHNLTEAEDSEIWEFAKEQGFCIVTQDADFADRSRLYGSPPKVLWLRCGNAPTSNVEAILRAGAETIQAFMGTSCWIALNCTEHGDRLTNAPNATPHRSACHQNAGYQQTNLHTVAIQQRSQLTSQTSSVR